MHHRLVVAEHRHIEPVYVYRPVKQLDALLVRLKTYKSLHLDRLVERWLRLHKELRFRNVINYAWSRFGRQGGRIQRASNWVLQIHNRLHKYAYLGWELRITEYQIVKTCGHFQRAVLQRHIYVSR